MLGVTEVVGVVVGVVVTDGDTGSASIGVDIGQQASSAGQGHVDQQTRLQQNIQTSVQRSSLSYF